MNIGNLVINGYAALAPMAGVADRAVRELCIEQGAAFSVSELVSAKGVSMGDKKSASLLACADAERPAGAQLFGSDPSVMATAAASAEQYKPDFIDINMGCPAPKVAGNGGGSALLKNPELAGKIVRAVCDAVSLPVTVKIRIGWDAENINAVQVAKICEENGAAAITVHGRTRKQMYAPGVDLETIAAVKKAVSIPVIGNGDVVDEESAMEMYRKTGCDLVMIGRAALGDPWIFNRINAYFKTGNRIPIPPLEERLRMCRREILLMHKYKDERNAILEARKHTAWYLKGLHSAATLRRECGEIMSMDDVDRICEKAILMNPDA